MSVASYKILFTAEFSLGMKEWMKDHRKEWVVKKINALIDNLSMSPFKGIGKPEPLKHKKNVWSRRITQTHRITYAVSNDTITILTCRGHYK
jgi:toxin YoeB